MMQKREKNRDVCLRWTLRKPMTQSLGVFYIICWGGWVLVRDGLGGLSVV